MSFPLMPKAQPPTFVRGQLIYRAAAPGTISVGQGSEDRWLIVVAARMSSGGIPAWSAPTVDGVAMTEVLQEFSSFGDDGQRGAVWAVRIPTGTTVSLSGTPASATLGVFTLTGVRDPLVSRIISGNTASQTAAVGAATIGYFITNFNSITAVAEMNLIGGGTANAIGYDPDMSASPLSYTVTNTGTLVFQRKISWPFNY